LTAALDRQLRDAKPVLVSSRRKADDAEKMPHKLIGSHVYEVVAVVDEKIHLHNPWNHRHPKPMTAAEFSANMEPDYTTLK